MSLPWAHHIICGFPIAKDYTVKVREVEGRFYVTTGRKGDECFFYPRDHTSREECEAIVAALQEDLKTL